MEAAGIEPAHDSDHEAHGHEGAPNRLARLRAASISAGQRSGGQALVQLTRGGLRLGARKADTESHAPAA
jgi:hypothetical protein